MARELTEVASGSAVDGYRQLPLPDPATPWRETPIAVVDFETTGLDPSTDEIVSFATVPIEDGKVRIAGSHYRLVRPKRMPGGDSIRIHGLRPADLEDAPSFEDVLDELLEAIAGRVLVAHVAAVERSFLAAALSRHGLELRNGIVDTAAMAAELGRRGGFEQGRPPAGLTELAQAFRLPVHRPHHADGDALTTAQVFLALATHLDRPHPLTVGEMQALKFTSPRRPKLRERLKRMRRDLIRSSARP